MWESLYLPLSDLTTLPFTRNDLTSIAPVLVAAVYHQEHTSVCKGIFPLLEETSLHLGLLIEYPLYFYWVLLHATCYGVCLRLLLFCSLQPSSSSLVYFLVYLCGSALSPCAELGSDGVCSGV